MATSYIAVGAKVASRPFVLPGVPVPPQPPTKRRRLNNDDSRRESMEAAANGNEEALAILTSFPSVLGLQPECMNFKIKTAVARAQLDMSSDKQYIRFSADVFNCLINHEGSYSAEGLDLAGALRSRSSTAYKAVKEMRDVKFQMEGLRDSAIARLFK